MRVSAGDTFASRIRVIKASGSGFLVEKLLPPIDPEKIRTEAECVADDLGGSDRLVGEDCHGARRAIGRGFQGFQRLEHAGIDIGVVEQVLAVIVEEDR